MGVSIKFIGNPKEFAAEVKKDFGYFRSGVASGIGGFMSSALDQVAKSGFIHIREESEQVTPPVRNALGQIVKAGKRVRRKYLYPEAPNLNIKSKDRRVEFAPSPKNPNGKTVLFPGRMIFAAGKVVSRRGRLPADLHNMQLRFLRQSDSGIVGQFGNGRSLINIKRVSGAFHAEFIPNERNMLAWLGFEYGRGVAGSMTVLLSDGSEAIMKGKVGQRKIIHQGLVAGMKYWNKAAQGKLDQYLKRMTRNAK